MLFFIHLDQTSIWPAGSFSETVAAMSRRSRNTRAWRYVWGGIRRDADARALVLASEMEEWNYDRLEVRIQMLPVSLPSRRAASNRMTQQRDNNLDPRRLFLIQKLLSCPLSFFKNSHFICWHAAMVPVAKLQVVQQLLTFSVCKKKEFSTSSIFAVCAVYVTSDIRFSHLHFHHPVQWLRLWGRLLSGDGPSGPQCSAGHWRVLLQLRLPGWQQLQPSPARLSPGQRLPLWRRWPGWVPVHLYFNCP